MPREVFGIVLHCIVLLYFITYILYVVGRTLECGSLTANPSSGSVHTAEYGEAMHPPQPDINQVLGVQCTDKHSLTKPKCNIPERSQRRV
jgi:hypothetical protein